MKSGLNRCSFIRALRRQLEGCGNLIVMTDSGSSFIDGYGSYRGLNFNLEYLERRRHLTVYFYQNPKISGSGDDSQEDQILRQGLVKLISQVLPLPFACTFESKFMPNHEGETTKYWVFEWDKDPNKCLQWRKYQGQVKFLGGRRYQIINYELREIHQIEGGWFKVEGLLV